MVANVQSVLYHGDDTLDKAGRLGPTNWFYEETLRRLPGDCQRRKAVASVRELAIEILRERGEPLHWRQVADEVLKRKPVHGKTPLMSTRPGLSISNALL